MERAIELLAQTQQQMAEVLMRQGEPREANRAPRAPIANLQDGEDIETFLLTFERTMVREDVDEEDWPSRLIPSLTGKARAAYNEVDARAKYYQLKEALLEKYEVTQQASKTQLRQMKLRLKDDVGEFLARLTILARRWLIPALDPDQDDAQRLEMVEQHVIQEIVMEQARVGLPSDLLRYLDARGPTTVDQVRRAIREYRLQRPAPEEAPQRNHSSYPPARARDTTSPGGNRDRRNPGKESRRLSEVTAKKENVTCYKCGKQGHYARECQEKAFGNQLQLSARLIRKGIVNGTETNRIQIDTGSTMTSVHQRFVAKAQMTRRTMRMRNMEGSRVYPTAMVTIELDGRKYVREAAVYPIAGRCPVRN